MTTPAKKGRGRPAIAPEDRAIPKSIRLTPADWANYAQLGGTPWLVKEVRRRAKKRNTPTDS